MTTIIEALDEFLLDQQARLNTAKTVKNYSEMVGLWVRYAGENRSISEVTRHEMREYVVHLRDPDRDLARDSIRSYINALRAFWKFVSMEYEITNAMQSIKEPKRKKTPKKGVDGRDFVKLFESTTPDKFGIRDRAVLAMFADTGARLGAVTSMRLDCIDVIRRTAQVEEKGEDLHTIFWTHFTNMLLDRWLRVRPDSESNAVFVSLTKGKESSALTKSGVYQIFRRLKQRSGVTGAVNPHAFRHNFANKYILSGGDIATLSKILNHKDISLTAEYYALFDDKELSQLHDKHSPILQMMKG